MSAFLCRNFVVCDFAIVAIIVCMKKLCVAVIALLIAAVGVAVWFSPLGADGVVYYDNKPIDYAGGCAAETLVRADYADEQQMNVALKRMLAKEVFRTETGGTTVIYAYSERVSAKPQTLSDGRVYNVMAAYSDGGACIGVPILAGSY